MQEHVKLEVSLEIVMANMAQEIFKMKKDEVENSRFDNILKIQERAYKADKQAINKILKGEM